MILDAVGYAHSGLGRHDLVIGTTPSANPANLPSDPHTPAHGI